MNKSDLERMNRQPAKNMKAATGASVTKQSNKGRPKLPRLTIEVLEEELHDRGISVRHEVVSTETDVIGAQIAGKRMTLPDLQTYLHSELSGSYSNCTMAILRSYLLQVGKRNTYNPILEYLNSLTWDKVDRMEAVYDLLGITADDELSRTLILKWIRQGYALLKNDEHSPYGADGILVFCGGQGLGKTSFFRRMSIFPERENWFRESQKISDRDKDDVRRCLTCWICELGELERTLKSDPAEIRGLVTRARDEFRVQYAPDDTKNLRHTNLCATCNSLDFLVDETGNRRFWTVHLTKPMRYKDICALDASQIWAQVIEQMSTIPLQDAFRLTEDEREELALRNGCFEKRLTGQREIEDIFEMALIPTNRYETKPVTLSQFKAAHDSLRPYSLEMIGRVLRKLNIEARQIRLEDGKRPRVYDLPMPKFCGSGWQSYAK